MKKFKKYEFDSQDHAQEFIDDLGFEILDGEKHPTHSNDVVKLGYLVTAIGIYDNDGNQITPPVLSAMFSVDVIWKDKKDKDWKDHRIKLNGKDNSHAFMGWEYSDNTI